MLGPGTPSLTTFTSLVISHFMALQVNSQISISSPHIFPNSRLRHPAASLTSICVCERHLRFNMSKIRLSISPQNLLSPVFLILINSSVVPVVQAKGSFYSAPAPPIHSLQQIPLPFSKYIQNLTHSHCLLRQCPSLLSEAS